jgi:hypothetical protein
LVLVVPVPFELLGREPAKGGVGPIGVVLDPPGFDNDRGFDEAAELLDVQELVTGPTVEGFDIGVLPRRTGSM